MSHSVLCWWGPSLNRFSWNWCVSSDIMTEAEVSFNDEFLYPEIARLLVSWIDSSESTSRLSCSNVCSLSFKHCWCFNFLHWCNLMIISSSVFSWSSQSWLHHTVFSSFNSDDERGVLAAVGSELLLIINFIQCDILIICNFFPLSAKLLNSVLITFNQSFKYCGLRSHLTLILRSCHQNDSEDLC